MLRYRDGQHDARSQHGPREVPTKPPGCLNDKHDCLMQYSTPDKHSAHNRWSRSRGRKQGNT
eukprot:3192562-Amphidinium_carterae.1